MFSTSYHSLAKNARADLSFRATCHRRHLCSFDGIRLQDGNSLLLGNRDWSLLHGMMMSKFAKEFMGLSELEGIVAFKGVAMSLIDFRCDTDCCGEFMESHFEHVASNASSTCTLNEQTVVCSRARIRKHQKSNRYLHYLCVYGVS